MRNYIYTSILFIIFSINLYGQKSTVKLLFAGDAMQHTRSLDAAQITEGYDYSSYFPLVKDKIKAADIAVVNLETTLPGKKFSGFPLFGAPDSFALALKDAGFNVFLTANNHSVDKGRLGIERTISFLDSIGVKHLGTYVDKAKRNKSYPLIIVKNGIRIGMLNYTYDTNGLDIPSPNIVNVTNKKQILKDIEWCKLMKADIIIANMHWGHEYVLKHNRGQERLANFLTDNGVRLVIGGHPHVVQPIDIQKKNNEIENVVVYSMGNFVSGMLVVNTDGGMMVNIEISKQTKDSPVKIEKCDYSLVYMHKPKIEDRVLYQLIPVEEYLGEKGLLELGEITFEKVQVFYNNAKRAIESLW